MPVLLKETEIKLQWSDIDSRIDRKPKYRGSRSSGIHLMADVLRPALIKSGILKPLDKEQLEIDEFPFRMACGMAMESWFQGLWPDMIWQPGELVKDGIIMTPDGVTLDGGELTGGEGLLEEMKATWCSRRTYGKDITEHRTWMFQDAGYLNGIELRYVRQHVWWMCGDYKQGPPTPMYVTYLLEFSQWELDDFWKNVVLNNKPEMELNKELTK